MSPWLVAILVCLAVYLAALVAVAWFSVRPYRIPFYISPGSLGAPQEDVEFASTDGTILRGWFVSNEPEHQSDGAPRVAVFAHGYMMNRCELVPEAYLLWQRGFSCLLFDFRAHGKSAGRVCTLGVRESEDVEAAVHFARQRRPDSRVVLIGSSMGSAASAMAAGRDHSLAQALVLDSAYGSLASATLGWWRFLGGPVLAAILNPTTLLAWPMTGVNPFKVDLPSHISKCGPTPILFCHGERDTLALPKEAKRNIEAAERPASETWFAGCGHSEGRWLQSEKYREAVLGFLAEQGFIDAEVLERPLKRPSASGAEAPHSKR